MFKILFGWPLGQKNEKGERKTDEICFKNGEKDCIFLSYKLKTFLGSAPAPTSPKKSLSKGGGGITEVHIICPCDFPQRGFYILVGWPGTGYRGLHIALAAHCLLYFNLYMLLFRGAIKRE